MDNDNIKCIYLEARCAGCGKDLPEGERHVVLTDRGKAAFEEGYHVVVGHAREYLPYDEEMGCVFCDDCVKP